MSSKLPQIVSDISDSYVGRESQTKQLSECLRQLCRTVIVYGLRSTAKTSVVKSLCDRSHSLVAYVNCNEFFANKAVYENILNQLNDKINLFDEEIVCNSLSDLIDQLKQLLDQFNRNRRQLSKETVFTQCIIVLDSIDSNDHLVTTANNELITSLTNLQELTQNVCPITCIFITRQSIEWFRRITCYPMSAIQINFDNYSSEQLLSILSKDCPKDYDNKFYRNYVNLIIKSVHHMTRDLTEIRCLCLTHFGEYVRPIIDDEMSATESAKLYKRFQPTLSRITDTIGLNEVHTSSHTKDWSDSIKYLLIACYLASYSWPKNDKKVFVKYEGKRRERKRKVLLQDRDCEGPKSSTFERVLHIYESIIELNAQNKDKYLKESSNRLFAQFQELLSLKYINRTVSLNKNNYLSSLTKYQISSSVTFDFITDLSQKLDFNIKAFVEQ